METRCSSIAAVFFFVAALMASSSVKATPTPSFEENFNIMWSENHFTTSEDGQIWNLALDNDTGCGFQTKHMYRFGWFSMKLKLVGGDSAGVVTAYYMCSENGAGPERDEVDFEFLGNRTGEPYIVQTNVFKNGTGNREMRHSLWFDPTEDYHSYSILWNNHQLVFFVDRVPIRVYRNSDKVPDNDFFPNKKPMYLFSSIWNADDWATRGGLEKTDWKKAPFVSSYKDFAVDACRWEDPYPACVSTTTDNWWDQYDAWHLSKTQKTDYAWVQSNHVLYDYCQDRERFNKTPWECSIKESLAPRTLPLNETGNGIMNNTINGTLPETTPKENGVQNIVGNGALSKQKNYYSIIFFVSSLFHFLSLWT